MSDLNNGSLFLIDKNPKKKVKFVMLVCYHCGYSSDQKEQDFQLDGQKGFWCVDCDGYTYNNIQDKHRFKLILEDQSKGEVVNNYSDIKLSKRLSILRYPGGKTRIINFLYNELKELNSTSKLISPFTGGGSFELSMLDANIVEELHLNDLDFGVFSIFWVIKHMPDDLKWRLKSERPNHKSFFRARNLIRGNYRSLNILEAAWTYLLVNRLAYSGIVNANPLGGKNGTPEKLLSRWNPDDLIKRIDRIHSLSDKITITNTDAVELIEEQYWNKNATIFIDPPYFKKGKQLYNHYFRKEDHINLSVLLDSLHQGMPGADIILTYDYHEFIEKIFEQPEIKKINRSYSI